MITPTLKQVQQPFKPLYSIGKEENTWWIEMNFA